MPKEYEKYLKRLSKNWKIKIAEAVISIQKLEIDHLDIKKLIGFENLFRCRIGQFRIVFEKAEGEGIILAIDSRGDIYKKF